MRGESFEGIEVSGLGVDATVRAFKLLPSVVLKRLVEYGIGGYQNGQIVVDSNAWYPLGRWLEWFHSLAQSLGPRALFQIGHYVPSVAVLPPTLKDVNTAVAGTNIAYHMNHRKNGVPMFDVATGTLLGGIGDYGYTPFPGEKRILSRCDTPYPCEFDRGVLHGFAARFDKDVRVEHVEPGFCRKKSDEACFYTITW